MMHLNDITSLVKGQHLSLSERIEIQSWKRLDKSNRFIALTLGRSHSTINDEIKRGTAVQKKLVNGKAYYLKAYYAETGHLLYKKHREVCKPQYKLLKVEGFIKDAKQKIQVEKWSPYIIVGRAIELGTYEPYERICAKTLYRSIDEGLMSLNKMDLWLKLQRNTKPKRDRERKRNLGRSIDERPWEINERSTFGHWEIDTVIGKKTKDEPVLLTLTERLTRYQVIIKIKRKQEASVHEALRILA